jgi:hypothetical protein
MTGLRCKYEKTLGPHTEKRTCGGESCEKEKETQAASQGFGDIVQHERLLYYRRPTLRGGQDGPPSEAAKTASRRLINYSYTLCITSGSQNQTGDADARRHCTLGTHIILGSAWLRVTPGRD